MFNYFKSSFSFFSLLLVAIFSSGVVYASTLITVTGNSAIGENQPGWLFNRDITTKTPYEFNFDAASIGYGSLYVLPIGATAADKFIGENFLNKPIADVESISYDFKIGENGAISQEHEFYMNVYANFSASDDLKYYDCRYSIVPTVGSKDEFTTVVFDPNMAYPVATRGGNSASPYTCPSVPAQMDAIGGAGANIRMFALNVGDTTANDASLDGYYDNVVVDLVDGTTVYDFEPVIAPTDKDSCKKNGWMMFNTPFFKNQGECVSSMAKSK